VSVDYFDVCGVHVSAVNIDKACVIFDQWIKAREKHYVCVAPASTIVQCQDDEEYKAIINKAGMVTPDGMPLVWIAKSRGLKEVERTYGPDLLTAVAQLSPEKGYKHFFYGGTEEVCQKLRKILNEKYPGINIVGMVAPPFRDLTDKEHKNVINQINDSKADILWVGLGSPKQDIWISTNRDRLDVPIMLGVGAAFDFISGVKKHAPRWIQRSGLEWLFRFCCEPRRLWRRYILGNAKFIYYLISDFLRKKRIKFLCRS